MYLQIIIGFQETVIRVFEWIWKKLYTLNHFFHLAQILSNAMVDDMEPLTILQLNAFKKKGVEYDEQNENDEE